MGGAWGGERGGGRSGIGVGGGGGRVVMTGMTEGGAEATTSQLFVDISNKKRNNDWLSMGPAGDHQGRGVRRSVSSARGRAVQPTQIVALDKVGRKRQPRENCERVVLHPALGF